MQATRRMGITRLLFLAIAGVHLLLGLCWMLRNLGDVPHYHDTIEYIHLARELRVDAYRGIAYPALLAGVDRAWPGARILELRPFERRVGELGQPCAAPRGLIVIQILQIAVAGGAIAYFLVTVAPFLRGHGHLPLLFATGLVTLDALVAHHNQNVMTDSLALSASLVLCAASSRLVLGTGGFGANAVLVTGSALLAASLRPEKRWVVLGAWIGTWLISEWWASRRTGELQAGAPRRARAGVLCAAVGCALAMTLAQAVAKPSTHWPLRTTLAHQRIIYPHLSAVYDELPERTRRLLPRQHAAHYDRHVNFARNVVNNAVGNDPRKLEELTQDMVTSAWEACWPAILLDVAKDTAENALAPLSFYVRLAVAELSGRATFARWFQADGTTWTYDRLTMHHPALSRVYVLTSLLVLLAAIPLALLGAPRRRVSAAALAPWLPALCFAGVNAAAFAMTADLVSIRYTLFSHTALLALVYTAALRQLHQETPGAP